MVDQETAVVNPSPTPQETAHTAEVERHSSWLGPSYETTDDSEASTDSTEETTEQASAGEETADEGQSSDEATDGAAAGEGEEEQEEDENWLPDEQSKVFPDEILARYAKRYGKTLDDVQKDPHLKQLIQDKINSDIFIAGQKAAGSEDEPTVEDETQATETATPATPEEQYQQYQQQVQTFVERTYNKEAIAAGGKKLMEAIGFDFSKPDDPETKQWLEAAPKVGQTLAEMATDMVNTALPVMLAPVLEHVMPGITRMYERTLCMDTWDAVRNAPDAQGQPKYGELPEFGSKEFRQAAQAAAKKYSGGSIERFESMVFTDPKTHRPYPPQTQLQLKYEVIASLMNGTKPDAKVIEDAVNAGKKQERTTEQKRKAGAALGSGKQTRRAPTATAGSLSSDLISAYGEREGTNWGSK